MYTYVKFFFSKKNFCSKNFFPQKIKKLTIFSKKKTDFFFFFFGQKKKIFFSKRIGSMPHGGYRAFNNQLIYTLFPNFKFNLLKLGQKNFN